MLNTELLDQSGPTSSYDALLAGYLRALPRCETVEAVLRLTLEYAQKLTGGAQGVALAAGKPPSVVPATPNTGLLHAAREAWTKAAGLARAVPSANGASDADGSRILFVPLHITGVLHGLLALRGTTLLSGPASEALDTLAQAAGRTLHLILTLRRADARLDELGMLYEVATVMGSTLDLPELLKSIVERTQVALRSEACTLMLLDEATEELVFEIPTGEAESALRQLRIPLSQGICGWVARTGQPAIVNDPQADSRFDTQVDQNSGFVTRQALAVPLRVRGQISGVLEVLNKMGNLPYSDEDLDLLTTLAGQAAVALDNAQLYTSLQAEHEKFLAAEEQVRKELARDLHDGPAQRLAAICMEVEILRKLLTSDPSRLPGELDSLETLARKANREVRTLQFQLRPVMLETRGLRAAIEYYVNQLQETERVQFTLTVEGCKGRLPAKIEQAAFGIVQEALGNIRKHSGASHATIRMVEEPDRWVLTIVDDGRGFDVAAVLRSYETRGSLGLLNMRERGQAVGGNLDLTSIPGAGTTVRLAIPSTGAMPGDE